MLANPDLDTDSIQSIDSLVSESDISLTDNMSVPSRPPSPWVPAQTPETEFVEDDKDFFIQSSFVVFQVEGCRFRVPSYLLEKESKVFFSMMSNFQRISTEPNSISNPIILPVDEYTKEDFRNFLKALYPTTFTPKLVLSKSEYLSILHLSTKWSFPNLRRTAISELEPTNNPDRHLTSVEKITYGRKYSISKWITTGLADLVKREKPLTNGEALAVSEYVVSMRGLSAMSMTTTAFGVFRLREAHRSRKPPAEQRHGGFDSFGCFDSMPTGSASQAQDDQVTKDVENEFQDELADVRRDESTLLLAMSLDAGGDTKDKIVEDSGKLKTSAGSGMSFPEHREELDVNINLNTNLPQGPPPVPEPEVPVSSERAISKKKKGLKVKRTTLRMPTNEIEAKVDVDFQESGLNPFSQL